MMVQNMHSQISKRSTWGTHLQNACITMALVLSSIMTVIFIFLLETAARWKQLRTIPHPREICSVCMMTALSPPTTHLQEKRDRKSTRLNSSHVAISYAVFCLK